MNIWVDAQLSPVLAKWINQHFSIDSVALRDLGLRDSTDLEIFKAAKEKSAIVMTKDSDFLQLLDNYGSPPKVIWITCGNTSNLRIQQILLKTLPETLKISNQEKN